MENFTQLVFSTNQNFTKILDYCKSQNIISVKKLIPLLNQSFADCINKKENDLIDLFQHIIDSYSKSEQQAIEILKGLKKKGVVNICILQKITDKDAVQVGLKIDESKELISILEDKIMIDKEDIHSVFQKLKENGINSEKDLLKIPFEEAEYFGIPKYSFLEWVEKSNPEKQKIQSLISECQKLDMRKCNGKSVQFYKYPIYKKGDLKDLSDLKTLFIIGETGVGKSTFINFFSNYYIGVQLDDPYRFLIVNENGQSSAVSSTSDVTEYYLKGFGEKPHLQIIDTPGFGDTKGYAYDNKISSLITEKLQNLDSITLICFVIQSSNSRLTATQQYIINRVLQLFGSDVMHNFMFLFTFFDGKMPPLALEAITFKGDFQHSPSPLANLVSKIREPFWQTFNNAGFQEENPIQKFYWDTAYKSFKKFYKQKILKTSFVSLALTKDVIKERKQIQNIVRHLKPDLDAQLHLINSIETNKLIIINLSKEQEAAKSKMTYTCEDYDTIKIYLKPNEYVSNCINCSRTCHYPCLFPNSEDKRLCSAMQNDKCTVCPKKCLWKMHENMNFRFEAKLKIVKVEFEQLIARYQLSSEEQLTKEALVQRMESELEIRKKNCLEKISTLKNSINRLNEIAAQPAISDSESDYIKTLISVEEQNKNEGYKERIRQLEIFQEEFEFLNKQIQQKKKIEQ